MDYRYLSLAQLEELKKAPETEAKIIDLDPNPVVPEDLNTLPTNKTKLPDDIVAKHNAKRLEKEMQRKAKENL